MLKPADRLAIFERADGRCAICGDPLTWADFDVDHILPVSAGGGDGHANLRAAHIRCNRSRGNDGYPVIVRRRGARRLNVEVYPDEEALVRRVRAVAAERGETLHDLVMAALRKEIGWEEAEEAAAEAPAPARRG